MVGVVENVYAPGCTKISAHVKLSRHKIYPKLYIKMCNKEGTISISLCNNEGRAWLLLINVLIFLITALHKEIWQL